MNEQPLPRLQLVKAINQISQHYPQTTKHQVSVGQVWGWRDDNNAPLIIKLENGVHFACSGISEKQRRSAMAAGAIGQKVAFFHRGVDRQGKPIDPSFKTLLLDGVAGFMPGLECLAPI